MQNLDIDTMGHMLEDKGMTHDDIDLYFEHHGVKGMKWGERHAVKKAARQKNRALNNQSRSKDRNEMAARSAKQQASYTAAVDKARGRVASGKTKSDWKKAKAKYSADKARLGSREARKILQENRNKYDKDVNTARLARDGKEEMQRAIKGAVGNILVGTIAAALKA